MYYVQNGKVCTVDGIKMNPEYIIISGKSSRIKYSVMNITVPGPGQEISITGLFGRLKRVAEVYQMVEATSGGDGDIKPFLKRKFEEMMSELDEMKKVIQQ